jgi:hypothetical protein
LAELDHIAIEGEDREPLIEVVTDPNGLLAEVDRSGERLQALGFGAFADDGDIRLEAQHRFELAMQGHAAVPRDDPHAIPRHEQLLRAL